MTIHQQFIANQGFLECRGHEAIARSGTGEDGEVDPEEEEIEDQRNDNKADHTGEEVFGDAFLHRTLEERLSAGNTRIRYQISCSPKDPKGRT